MNIAENIERKIKEKLEPVTFVLVNDSERHKGHAGDNGSGQSHFTVKVVSPHFIGKGVLERHRMVHDLLQDEFKAGLHALSIKADIPAS